MSYGFVPSQVSNHRFQFRSVGASQETIYSFSHSKYLPILSGTRNQRQKAEPKEGFFPLANLQKKLETRYMNHET